MDTDEEMELVEKKKKKMKKEKEEDDVEVRFLFIFSWKIDGIFSFNLHFSLSFTDQTRRASENQARKEGICEDASERWGDFFIFNWEIAFLRFS